MRIDTSLRAGVVAAALIVVIGGCESLTVPDFNNPGLDELTQNPSRSAVVNASQGLMVGARRGIGEFNRYVSALGVLGRESYIFDPSDPRFVTELLQGPLDPGGASFGGGGHWADRYKNIRSANILLDALPNATDFTTQELEAIRGYVKTLVAPDFLLVVNTRDDFGAPIDVNRDPTGDPAPIATKDEVFNRIVTLLEEAKVHLNAGGSSFPFQLSSGFSGFDTPATFLGFNRALLARVHVYRQDWAAARTALGESFLNASAGQGIAGLHVGVYHAYSSGSGDRVNGLFGRRDVLPAHPSIVTDAQAGDARVDRKTVVVSPPVGDPGGTFGVSSDRLFTIYDGLSAPIPFIRNEELLLLRAEVNLQEGNLDAARTDINLVRSISGGLAPIAAATWNALTPAQRVDELLYNRRYSLLWEGHRWIDMRRYDRLADLPVDHPTFVRFRQFPIPAGECVGRSPAPAGCSVVQGF